MAEKNQAPIIVRKMHPEDEQAHGGAWKIALADMMTAMMAFFLLLWLLSATDKETLTGIADHFKPPEQVVRQMIAGADGAFGGQSILDPEGLPLEATSASDLNGNNEADAKQPSAGHADSESLEDKNRAALEIDQQNFRELEQEMIHLIAGDPALAPAMRQVAFIREKEGLRIQIVDDADSSMFAIGTSTLLPQAADLIAKVAQAINRVPNRIILRGHTDSHAYKNTDYRNNWILSTERAEATRQYLVNAGIDPARFVKIEGVADTDAYNPDDLYDPSNRRINIILKFQRPQ